jgi:hypothetical protein
MEDFFHFYFDVEIYGYVKYHAMVAKSKKKVFLIKYKKNIDI